MRLAALLSARQTNCASSQRRPAPTARTARRMDDCSGRSPDLRVDASFRLPGKKPQWHLWKEAHRLQLRAQLRIWLHTQSRALKTAPHSHLADPSTSEPEGAHHPNKTAAVNVAQCGLTRLQCVSSVAGGSARTG